MPETIAGKRVLVTGAAAGIGLATAKLFAQEGADVFGFDLRWQAEIPDVTCVVGDVTSGADVQAAVDQAAGERGLDILVANAGVVLIDDWRTAAPEEWATVFDVNVIGVMRCFQAAALNMIQTRRKGRLLATASIAGSRPYPEGGSYCASKAAVTALVESAALAFAADGITVNAVAPGPVDTEMLRGANARSAAIKGRNAEDLWTASIASIPLGRLAQPDDIAQLFLFLSSDQSAYLTGVTVRCDGGTLLL